jgi:Mg-chelatase subunit ChlD
MMSLMRNMTIVILNIFLILTIVITAANAQTQFTNSTPKKFSELGIDPTAFPKIKVNLFIDKICVMAGNLKKEDFKVKEDDIDAAIDNFYFTGNASGQKLDLVIVFDETTSMDAKINALKSKVKDLTQKINSSKLDARYSLVTFNGADVTTKINWTNDADSFRNVIGKLTTSGGNTDLPENSIDGIERALSFGFRPDTQKVIIVVTDEPSQQKGDGKSNSAYTMDDVKSDLLNSSALLIAVSPDFRNRNVDPNVPRSDLPKYADMRDLASQSSSMWIDINSADFTTIMEQFKGIITGTYVIEYTTPDQTSFGSRNVTVSVDALGCLVDNDSSSYIVPENLARLNNPPTIDSMTSDKTSPQDARTAITWTANAIDPDGDLVLYRFFLDGWPMTQWAEDKTWIWVAGQAGSYRVEVQVRDAKHADPNGLDDRRVESFTINEPKPAAPGNLPPIVDDLLATQDKAKEIAWTTNATDSDEDQILYRYFLNNKSMTDWNDNDKWTLNASEANVGENQVAVQIRDGKHSGLDDYDDTKSVRFRLSSMKLMVQTWIKTFDAPQARAYSVQQVDDHGYFVAGGRHDAWIIKTDANGNKVWDKTFGGPEDDVAYSAQQTIDGGYIITGETQSYGSGNKDVWLIKTDSSGNKVWSKTFGGPDEDQGDSVSLVRDGGYVIVGGTGYNPGKKKGAEVWLIKTDANGNKVWDKTFGGYVSSWGRSVEQTSDGGFIITGTAQVRGSGNPQNTWLIKTDSAGNKEWDKTFESISGDSEGQSIHQTSDGDYIMLCYKYTSPDGGIWLIKTDSQGRKIWDRTFQGVIWTDSERSIQQTSDGGYIITGLLGTNASLIKVNSEGNEEWYRTYEGINLGGNSVQQVNDGGYIVAGTTDMMGPAEVVLIKTDADGIV